MNYHTQYQKSLQDPIDFCKEQATDIDWFTFPPNILSKDEDDLYRWYKDGQLNTCYLALDHQVQQGRGA